VGLGGRVAVVTGASHGIGRAIAQRLLGEGASVVAADVDPAGRELEGERVRFVPCDVRSEDDVEAAVAAAGDAFGRLDVLVNNAGAGGAYGPIPELRAEEWDATFELLVRSVMLGTKHAARAMIAGGRGGSIVSTASIAGMFGGAAPMAYSAAKAAVISMAQTASVELAGHGIRVNAVCPGVIDTDMVPDRSPEVVATGRPEDVAAAVAYLAGDDARFVTGQALVVDGGVMAGGADYSRELFGTPRRAGLDLGPRRGA
jgi:NAD(P)-dependent dehydrogenase (short-subunit alcohol dehydrogenase family)